jgi:hypothetical protein
MPRVQPPRLPVALALLMLAACARFVEVPDNVTVSTRAARLPPGPTADFAAAPAIRAIWFSTLTLDRGANWAGAITTSSNVASVELRTDSFSFSVPRDRIGAFAFSYAIPDVPPYLRRSWVGPGVGPNSARDRIDEAVPIEIR